MQTDSNLNELDVVVITHPILEQKVQQGAIGTVLETFDDGWFLIEFADKTGKSYAILELQASQLLKVNYEPASA